MSNSPPQVTAFKINKFGRFGNNILQLIGALCEAHREHVNKVYVQPINDSLEMTGIRNWDDIEIDPGEPAVGEILREGPHYFFFYEHYDYLLYHRILAEVIRPIIINRLGTVPTPAPADDLYISIRAGDIFQGNGTNIHCAQPPLAYYQMVIAHHLQIAADPRIVVVYEDRSNPCVAALEKFLQDKPHQLVSTPDQVNGIRQRAGATTVAMGYGTFAQMIGLIFGNVRRIYGFRSLSLFDSWGGYFNPPFETRFDDLYRASDRWIVADVAGEFISNWQNTSSQLDLMLSYPSSKLRLLQRPVNF